MRFRLEPIKVRHFNNYYNKNDTIPIYNNILNCKKVKVTKGVTPDSKECLYIEVDSLEELAYLQNYLNITRMHNEFGNDFIINFANNEILIYDYYIE